VIDDHRDELAVLFFSDNSSIPNERIGFAVVLAIVA
jgi:hypothetical protein